MYKDYYLFWDIWEIVAYILDWEDTLNLLTNFDNITCMIDYFSFITNNNYKEVFTNLIFDQVFLMDTLLETEHCDILLEKEYKTSIVISAFCISHGSFIVDHLAFLGILLPIFKVLDFYTLFLFNPDIFYIMYFTNTVCNFNYYSFIPLDIDFFGTVGSMSIRYASETVCYKSIWWMTFAVYTKHQINWYYLLTDANFYIYINLLLFNNIIDCFLVFLQIFFYLIICIIEICSFILIIIDFQSVLNLCIKILYFFNEINEIFFELDYNVYAFNIKKKITTDFCIYFLIISILNLQFIIILFKLFYFFIKKIIKYDLNILKCIVNNLLVLYYYVYLIIKNFKYYLNIYPNLIKNNIRRNNIFIVFNYTWYKINKKIESILFYIKNKISKYIILFYKNQKGFVIPSISYISTIFIYAQIFNYSFWQEVFSKWKIDLKAFNYVEKLNLKKTFIIFFPYVWILNNYFRCYLHQVIIRYHKFFLFSIQFCIKFFIYKFVKLLLNNFLNVKIIHLIIYYFININMCVKKISKFLYNKLFIYFYLQIKIYNIYYINMYLHLYIFRLLTKFFFLDAYYTNVEMYDKYPFYQSKLLVNLFNFIKPINKSSKIYVINYIYFCYKLFFLWCFKIINLFLFFFCKVVKYIYYILLLKLNIIIYIYKTINIFIVLLFVILFLNFFYIKAFFFLFFFYALIYLFYKCINKSFWFIGFFFCSVIDLINIVIVNIFTISLFILKYLLVYPFILFLICFIMYNNTIFSFYFFDLIKHNYAYIHLSLYSYLDKLYVYNNIVFTLPNIVENINLFQNNVYIEYLNINDVDIFYIIEKYTEIFKKFEFTKKFEFKLHYNIYDFLDLRDFVKKKITRFTISIRIDITGLIKHYYYYLLLLLNYGIHYLFWSYKFIVLLPEDAYIYIFLKLYINVYLEMICIFFNNLLLIDLPFYIMKILLKVYIIFNEYSLNSNIVQCIFLLIEDVKHLAYINWILYKQCFIKINIYMIYNFYFILKLIIYFFDIYFYFFLDILYNCKLSYISDFLYVNTNLDFFFNKLYIKFALYKDVAYSWIRFPIKNSLLVNNEQLIFQNYESSSTKLKSKFKIFFDSGLIKQKKFFNNDFKYNKLRFWLQIIQYKPINFIMIYYKLFKLYKVFYFFPFLKYFYWMYSIYIYCFILLIIFLVYNKIYNNKYKYLYYSNAYLWDLLRKDTINNNFNWYKDCNKLTEYYNKAIIKNKAKIKNKNKKKYNAVLNNFSVNNENNLSLDILNKLDKLKVNLLKKKVKNKLNYLFFFNQYNKVKIKIEKVIYKSSVKKLIKSKINFLYKKNLFYKKYLNLSNKGIKKIIFNFKNFMLNRKYNMLYKFYLIEKKNFNMFSLFYYKKNISIPYIYEHWFEETSIDGPILFNINDINYNYLNENLYKLYFYFKWIDNNFFNNKGSFYWFHKDATVCYVGQDKKNNRYYFNSSCDASNNNYFIIILFIFFPLFVLITLLLSDLLHMYHTDFDGFYFRLRETIIYWFLWIVVNFEFLDKNIIILFFATLEHYENNIIFMTYQDYSDSVYTLFNYDKLNKKIFPLYLYYKREFILSQSNHLKEGQNNFIIFKIIRFSLDSLSKLLEHVMFFFFNIIDIFYIKLNVFDFYSTINILYYIFKCYIYIYFLYWLKFKQNFIGYKISKFYMFNKIYIDLFNFSNRIINNYYNNVKIYYNNINKK